jgi:hypothetical protein
LNVSFPHLIATDDIPIDGGFIHAKDDWQFPITPDGKTAAATSWGYEALGRAVRGLK